MQVIQDGLWWELKESSSSAKVMLDSSTHLTPQSSSPVSNHESLSVIQNNNF